MAELGSLSIGINVDTSNLSRQLAEAVAQVRAAGDAMGQSSSRASTQVERDNNDIARSVGTAGSAITAAFREGERGMVSFGNTTSTVDRDARGRFVSVSRGAEDAGSTIGNAFRDGERGVTSLGNTIGNVGRDARGRFTSLGADAGIAERGLGALGRAAADLTPNFGAAERSSGSLGSSIIGSLSSVNTISAAMTSGLIPALVGVGLVLSPLILTLGAAALGFAGVITAVGLVGGAIAGFGAGIIALVATTQGWTVSNQQVDSAQKTLQSTTQAHTQAVNALNVAQANYNKNPTAANLATLQAAQQRVKDATDAMTQAQNALTDAQNKANNPLHNLVNDLQTMAQTLGKESIPLATQFLGFLDSQIPTVQRFGENWINYFGARMPQALSFMGSLMNTFWEVLNRLSTVFQGFIDAVLARSPSLQPLFRDIFNAAVDAIGGLLQNLLRLTDWFTTNWPKIEPVVKGTFDALGRAIQAVIDVLSQVVIKFSDMWNLASKGDWEGVGTLAGRLVGKLADELNKVNWDAIVQKGVAEGAQFGAGFISGLNSQVTGAAVTPGVKAEQPGAGTTPPPQAGQMGATAGTSVSTPGGTISLGTPPPGSGAKEWGDWIYRELTAIQWQAVMEPLHTNWGAIFGGLGQWLEGSNQGLGHWKDVMVQTAQGIHWGDIAGSIPQAIWGAMQTPITLIETALGLSFLPGLVMAIPGFFAGLPGAIGGIFSAIGTTVSGWIGAIGGFFSGLGSAVQGAIGAIGGFFSGLGSMVQGIIGWFAGLPGQIGGAIASIPGIVGGIFSAIGATVSGWLNAIWGWVQSVWGGITGTIGFWLNTIWGWIQGIWGGITGTIGYWLNTIWGWVQGIWGGITGTIGFWLNTAWQWVQNIWGGITGTIGYWLNTIWGWVQGIWGGITGTIGYWLNTIWTWVQNIWGAITGTIGNWLNAIWNFVQYVWNGITGTIGYWLNTIWQWVQNIWNGITGTIGYWLNTIWQWIQNIWNGITGTIGYWLNTIWTDANNIWNGITGTVQFWGNQIWNFIWSTFNSLAGVVHNALSAVSTTAGNDLNWILKNVINAFLNKVWATFHGFGIDLPLAEVPHLEGFAYAAGGNTGVYGSPTFLVGEAGANESVISWDPKYRQRSLQLWAETGRQIGAFAEGGVIAQGCPGCGSGTGMGAGPDLNNLPTSGHGGQCLAFLAQWFPQLRGIPAAKDAAALINSNTPKAGEVAINTSFAPYGHAALVINPPNMVLDSNFGEDEMIRIHPLSDVRAAGFIDFGATLGTLAGGVGQGVLDVGSTINGLLQDVLNAAGAGPKWLGNAPAGFLQMIGPKIIDFISKNFGSQLASFTGAVSGFVSGAMNAADLTRLALQAGWPANEIPNVLRHIQEESGGNPNAVGPAAGGDGGSLGLLQVQPFYNPQFDKSKLKDPLYNLEAGLQIWKEGGWGRWSTAAMGAIMGPNGPLLFDNGNVAPEGLFMGLNTTGAPEPLVSPALINDMSQSDTVIGLLEEIKQRIIGHLEVNTYGTDLTPQDVARDVVSAFQAAR